MKIIWAQERTGCARELPVLSCAHIIFIRLLQRLNMQLLCKVRVCLCLLHIEGVCGFAQKQETITVTSTILLLFFPLRFRWEDLSH